MARSTIISLYKAIIISVPFKAKLSILLIFSGSLRRPLTAVVRRCISNKIEDRKRIVVLLAT
jgi:hypothetical protein